MNTIIEYSKQSRLGKFGTRWGCYATCIINVLEHEKSARLSDKDICAAVGSMTLNRDILVCNYKDHTRIESDATGWTQGIDPEWHYYVLAPAAALKTLLNIFGIMGAKNHYEIIKLRTNVGWHFTLKINGTITVNPDPAIHGAVHSITALT